MTTDIYNKAMHLLALREHSRKELQHKLLLRDYALPDVLRVLDEFAEKKLQSDERFAEAYVHSRRLKGCGPERIQMELQQRGVADELICAAVDSENEIWRETAARVYQKKFGKNDPKTFPEKVKRQQFMRYRGFNSRHIKFLRDEP
ncbi:MAG: regulatory protein RecX [Gammaproteobacteria bacterium]|nr:regulatory protein RecX [Gammaproteobacteria bacterium]